MEMLLASSAALLFTKLPIDKNGFFFSLAAKDAQKNSKGSFSRGLSQSCDEQIRS